MKLELEISPKTVKKIQALSVLTGEGSDHLNQELEGLVENHLNDKIVKALGLTIANQVRDTLNSSFVGVTRTALPPQEVEDSSLIYPTEEIEQTDMAEGLSEESFEDMDTDLPQETQDDLMFVEEEEEVAIKDKDGNDSNYDDPIMADLQAEAEEFEGDGQDSVMAAAAESHRGGATVSKNMPSDAPTGEDGTGLDILPVDLDLDKVSEDNASAMDFFSSAMNGAQGNKANRDQVRRVPKKNV